MLHCCVLGYKSDIGRKLPDLSFHSFPEDKIILKRWTVAVGKHNWTAKKSSKICSRHFVKEFLLKKKKLTCLRPEAIPTLEIHTHNLSDTLNSIEIVMPIPRDEEQIDPKQQTEVLAALAFYASGSYQRMVGANMHLGLSQPSVSLCLAEVTDALNNRDIMIRYIKFPENSSKGHSVMRRFYELQGFPGIVGCMDGTHVALIRPMESEEAYFNRKNYHSINTLIICDADLQILHVDSSFGSASHDAHVWDSSVLKVHMQNLHNAGERAWFLADSGYAQRPIVMTPILGAAPGSPEDDYTQQFCSARSTVERCIGVLKARWRCLLAHCTLQYDPVKAGRIVNACVVLHKMCNGARLPVPELGEEDRRRDAERQVHRDVDARPAAGTRLLRGYGGTAEFGDIK